MQRSRTLLGALVISTLLPVAASAQGGPAARTGTAAPEAGSPREQLAATLVRLEEREGQDPLVYRELSTLLRGAPDLVRDIPGLLRSGRASLDSSATLIFALEDIGSPEAQEALVAIQFDGSQRHLDRLRAVVSLGAVKEPTDEALGSLSAMALVRVDWPSTDLSNTALLSLGVGGGLLREQASLSYPQQRDWLVDHLYACSSPAETAMTLKAVGNLHDPALGDQVVYFLYSASAPVRACAAQALGALGDVSKRELLTDLLPEERFGAVRSAMTDALRELPASPHSLRTVLGLVRREPHNEARALMVSYLVDHLHDFEQARSTLREMTASDPSNEVRLLASISLRPPR
jgi:HEAT repeat protein